MTTSSIARSPGLERRRIAWLAPWLSRVVMIPPLLIMMVIGIRYVENPTHAASDTGVVLSTPEALTDTRVVGALAFAIAFAIATSLVSVRRLRIGHLTIAALMLLILAVRFFGFAEDGTTLAMGNQKTKVIGETLFLSLNLIAFALQTYLVRKTSVPA